MQFQFYFFLLSFLPNFIATDILISPSKCLTLTIFSWYFESLKQLQKASQEKPIEQTQPVQIQNLEVNSTKNSQMIIIVNCRIILNSPIKTNHLSRCQFFKSKLELKGFTYLPESKPWADLKAGKYFTTRNGSSLHLLVRIGKLQKGWCHWVPY